MILKRLYIRGRKYPYYFHPEIQSFHELVEFAEDNPHIDTYQIDNATYFFTDLTHEEQHSYWSQGIKNIMRNTRWVLDNLDSVCEFKVRWNHYGKKRNGVGCPPVKVTEQLDTLCNVV